MSDRTRLDLGALTSNEGYFLTRNSPQRAYDFAADETDWRFGATFRDSPTTLRDQVLDLIRTARRKIFVTSFILGDDLLISALVGAAERLNGGVYVISELSERSLRTGLARLAGTDNVTEAVAAEKKRFLALTTRGVAVRGHRDCHAKFVVADDEIAWVGSANLETRAFTVVGEAGVVLRDRVEVDRLARLFARMWLSGCEYELPSSADSYQVDERRDRPSTTSFTVPLPPGGSRPAVIWTGSDTDNLLTSIHEVIRMATRRLRLATFSLNGMAERPDLLLEPVAEAIQRGVRVEMLLRAMNRRDRHRRDAAHLHRLGVSLAADDLNHAKAVTADDHAGALFSANFDAKHGLDKGSGIEVGARLDHTPALAHLNTYLDHALMCATREFIDRPTARDLHDRLGEQSFSPWPLAHDLELTATEPALRRLAAATEPLLWHQVSPTKLSLTSETGSFTLDTTSARLDLSPEPGQTREAVEESCWRGRSASGNRGYCPAVLHLSPPPI